MGDVWLQTSDGKLIHLPVVGGDVNSPDDAVKIPTSAVMAQANRAVTGQVAIVTPTHGTITLDFTVPSRTGSCNQCGSCCCHPVANCQAAPGPCGYIVHPRATNYHVCQYLTINPGANKLGKPGQTSCSLYSSLFDNYKGCIHGPQKPVDIWSWMTACGYEFP
jgi:hypothetical protein